MLPLASVKNILYLHHKIHLKYIFYELYFYTVPMEMTDMHVVLIELS